MKNEASEFIVEGNPILHRTSNGYFMIMIRDSFHGCEIQFHDGLDVRAIVNNVGGGEMFIAEGKPGDNNNVCLKWIGPCVKVTFVPTGKSERGDEVFARLIRAQTDLGAVYSNGCGVTENDALVADWYRKAAEWGYADAQYKLGCMYENGRGVEKDGAFAVEWYRKAAEQGHAKAQDKLLMYVRMYHQMASTHISDCYFLPLRELSCHEPNYGQDFINVREILTVEKHGDTLEVQRYPIDVPWNIIRELYLCVFQDYSDENSEGHSNVRYLYGVYDHAWINRWQGGHRSRRWNTTSSILDMQQIFAAFETIAQNHNYLAPFRYKNAYVEEIDRPQPISCEEYLGQLCEIEKRTREKYDANFEEQWENMSHSVVAQARNAEQIDVITAKDAYLQEKRLEYKEQIDNSVKAEIAKYIHEIKVHYYNNARRYIFAQKYAETLSTSRILERLGSDVMMYSTDTIGWTNFDYIISDDVRIKVQTNFGYGVASYFRIIFSYKGIPILPYSMYVNYYYARSRDLARYTRNYDLDLDRKCWERSFDFVVETSNMAASNPDAFVKEWVMREVNDMIEGLRAIVNNPNSVMDKWLDKVDESENESPYLHVRQMDGEAKKHYECYPHEMAMELKAKKISGALDFLESLASLKEIYENVETAIVAIKNLAVKIVPEISETIESITADIAELKKHQAVWQQRKLNLQNWLNRMDEKIKVRVEEKVRLMGLQSERALEQCRISLTNNCREQISEYSPHVCALSWCDRKLSSIDNDIALRNKFKESLEQCCVRIESHPKTRYMICNALNVRR